MPLAVLAWLGLLGLSQAWAAEPIVYVGDGQEALVRVRAALETPEAEFELVSLESLLASAEAFTEGAASVTSCAGRSVSNADLHAMAERLSAAILMGLVEQRADVATDAIPSLACLDAPADPTGAARLLLAAGTVLQLSGDELGAERAHVAARAFDQRIPWNPDWPEEARRAFDRSAAVVLVEEPQVLDWRPVDAEVWVDGQKVPPAEVERVPGVHLVQWGEPLRSVVLDLTGAASVVLPSAFEAAPLLEGPGAALGPLLDQELGQPAMVYLASRATLKKGTSSGRPEARFWKWSSLEVVPTIAPGEETTPRTGRAPTALVVAGGGAAALVFGGVFAAVNDSIARKASEDAQDDPGQGHRADCRAAIDRRTVGQMIAFSGATVLVGGLTIQFLAPLDGGGAPLVLGAGGRF
ncbi:MAG: hypothetical protein JRI25_09305 [Deltaproteobacteria bacterium]|nr:hypothetical protein [Deltaproteobacteria bacterium]MBW2254778.1 hypothetical protein [Deltaproteobacteria bacterium]